jgi:integrase
MSDPTRRSRRRKAADRPKKPYPDFPLTPHASGAWMKKIRGKIHYFGKWARRVDGKLVRVPGDGWEEALEQYKAVAEDLHAGRTPRVRGDGLTVAGLCNAFLTAKLRKREAGELGARMFEEYKQTTDLIVAALRKDRLVDDLAADDFESLRAAMAERWGPVRLGNAITRVKSVFKYGLDNGLIEKAVRYGSEFRKPDKAVLRRHRAQNGTKMIEADDLRRLIDAAPVPLRAMVLLGLNCGFGNGDCATLPLSALDLEQGWVDYPRPKTGIPRRCPIWAETVAALREALALRPGPRQDEAAGLAFLTSRGTPWIHFTGSGGRVDNVAIRFGELLKALGLHRAGLGFYTLRHVFRTVADAARDPVAIDLIMGHADPSMGGHYRERVEDSRLRAVAEHVRRWLFGEPRGGGAGGTAPDSSDPCGPCDPTQENAAETGAASGSQHSGGSQAGVARPVLATPENPAKTGLGSEGAHGSQKSGPVLTADGRPALRLYVG